MSGQPFETDVEFDDQIRVAPEGILSGVSGLSEQNVLITWKAVPLPHYSVTHGSFEVGRSAQAEQARLMAERRAEKAEVGVEWRLPR